MPRRDAVEQVAVVGDQDERARELEQALLEHLERRDVEVVGRLVEDQQVGGLEHQPREQDARLLAAREPADRRVELLGAEQEALRPRGDVDAAALEDHRVPVGRERARSESVGVEARAVLLEEHDLQAGRALDRARVGRLLPGEQAQQRGLAAAVRAEQAQPRARREDEVEAAHDRAVRRSSSRAPRPPRAASSCAPSPRSRAAAAEVCARASRSASSSCSRSASSMRACALRVRARALRDSQSSSRRTRLASDSW